jgi:Ni/Co efflux regulator RcnB
MRKLILAAAIAATVLPAAAQAQHGPDREQIRQDRHELRHDRREMRRDRREMQRERVAYVAPYGGWHYAPINNGYTLRPGFYDQRYQVSDYNRYNLTAPGRNLRWVRYGNDLLLVNVRNGRVLRVLHNRYYR